MTSAVSEDQINGLRLRLLIDKAENVLRAEFHDHYASNANDLYDELYRQKNKIQKLFKKKIIRQDQFDLLLPSNGMTDSSKFDLTLLTLLLREFCGLAEPITGWSDLPLQADQSVSANLVRIRIGRNKLQHGKLAFREPTFTNSWDKICHPLIALGCSKKELINLKTESLDPKSAQQFNATLNQLLKRVADLEDALDGVSYNVLPSTPCFVGRKEFIEKIHKSLKGMSENKLGLVISGLGGIGKTEVIRQYCQQYVNQYNYNIIWINAEQKSSIRADFINVAEQISLNIKDTNGHYIGVKAIMAKVYRFFAGRPCLFVLDNVPNGKFIYDIFKNITSPRPAFILTSQFTEWDSRFVQEKLTILTKESAFGLLRQKLTENEEQLGILIDKVQCLPLALMQAVAYITQCCIKIKQYIEEFDSHPKHVMSTTYEDIGYHKTIATTWKMALSKIMSKKDATFIISMMSKLSYLDGKDINKKLFTEKCGNEFQVTNAIRVLKGYSLISEFSCENDSDQTITMHSLVQLVIQMYPGNRDGKYLLDLLESFFRERKDKKSTMHADFGKHWINHFVYMFNTQKTNENFIKKLFDNIEKVFDVFNSKGKWIILNEILSAMIELRSWNYFEECKIKSYIAKCFWYQCKPNDALNILLPVEETKPKYLPKNCESVVLTRILIAGCYERLGKVGTSLDILREIDARSKENQLEKQEIMSFLLMRNKEYAEALKTLRAIESERGPGNHRDVFVTKQNIAECLRKQGEYKDALAMCAEVVDLVKENLGPKHPDLLKSLYCIACCKKAQIQNNDYDDLLETLMDLEQKQIEIIGANHPYLLLTQENIAICLRNQGKFEDAVVRYYQIEEMKKELQKSPFSILNTQKDIAYCLHKQKYFEKKYDLELEICEKIQQSSEILLGPNHQDVLNAHLNIVDCLTNLGNYEMTLDKLSELNKTFPDKCMSPRNKRLKAAIKERILLKDHDQVALVEKIHLFEDLF